MASADDDDDYTKTHTLSETEILELANRLKEVKETWEKNPVPPELTDAEKKQRIKKIHQKRKLATA